MVAIAEIRNRISNLEKLDWVTPSEILFDVPISKQREINEAFNTAHSHVLEKKPTDDEDIAEYISIYLQSLNHMLDKAEAIKILNSIFWVFDHFSSSYVVHICSEFFAEKVHKSAIDSVLAESIRLGAELNQIRLDQWQHFHDALAIKNVHS